MWLQFGYNYSEEPLETIEFADQMDEKRNLNAVFHKLSRSESRVGIIAEIPKCLEITGFLKIKDSILQLFRVFPVYIGRSIYNEEGLDQ